jgi:ribonuclease HI
LNQGYYCAYIDGSFNQDNQSYGSGIVLIKSPDVIEQYSFVGKEERYVESRNVAGEVFALIRLLEILKKNNQSKAVVYFDYIGIENWYNNKWQTKSNIALYLLSVKQNYRNLELVFKKVLAHSNDKYNDLADKLAKRAVGI